MMKDVAMVSLEAPALHLPGWTEENHEKNFNGSGTPGQKSADLLNMKL
jgi:hypothetical protein